MMFNIWIPLLFMYGRYEVDSACNPISIQDISDAAQLSTQIFNPTLFCHQQPCTALKKGDKVNRTSGYVVDQVYTRRFDNGHLKAIVASKKSPATTIIAFRGTTSLGQLIDQFQSGLAEKWKTLPYPGNMKVMRYDWDALQKLNVIKKLKLQRGTKYIITGHSLGGALATV